MSLLPDFIEYPESQVYSTVVPGQYVSIKSVPNTDNSPLGGIEQTVEKINNIAQSYLEMRLLEYRTTD